jgi:hypothetical protein
MLSQILVPEKRVLYYLLSDRHSSCFTNDVLFDKKCICIRIHLSYANGTEYEQYFGQHYLQFCRLYHLHDVRMYLSLKNVGPYRRFRV